MKDELKLSISAHARSSHMLKKTIGGAGFARSFCLTMMSTFVVPAYCAHSNAAFACLAVD